MTYCRGYGAHRTRASEVLGGCQQAVSNRGDWACCSVLCCSVKSLSAFSYNADHVTLGQGIYLILQGQQLALHSCGHQANQQLQTQFSFRKMDTAMFSYLVLSTIHYRLNQLSLSSSTLQLQWSSRTRLVQVAVMAPLLTVKTAQALMAASWSPWLVKLQPACKAVHLLFLTTSGSSN
ncbi:TPA: hypothetical protein ACH3X2_009554 [Trebouxia sp. C0005]